MVIENNFWRIAVRELGAELTSLFYKPDNTEHLWQGNPAIWNGQAPVLFPIVGTLFGNTLTVNGKQFEMQRHGFARKTNFNLLAQKSDSLLFEMASNATTKAQYPFDFRFQILYRLSENELRIRYTVINTDTQEILFAVGGHPAFNVPFSANEKYEDYCIEFEKDTHLERSYINKDGFFDGRKSLVLNNTNQLHLHPKMFADDALIFKNLQSRKVILRSKNHAKTLSVSFPDFHYLGLWAKVDAPYICIEPWLGCADENGFRKEFQEKDGIIRLAVGKTFAGEYRIGVG